MAAYVVMERPDEGHEKAVFVRDGFTMVGFLLPVVWLLWQRLWIEGALAIGAALLLAAAEGSGGSFALAPPLVSILLSIYVGLEGPALRIAALRRRGYADRGVVEADSLDEAEIRYYAGVDPAGRDAIVTMAASPSRPAVAGPALGLLAYPGAR
ncbi:MAG TPA: DUF2628 domain-containing protein [Rhizobiales bacterium]|nr:DUF2628 domain-containing protein [Hyphomicrobiales bacterium]